VERHPALPRGQKAIRIAPTIFALARTALTYKAQLRHARHILAVCAKTAATKSKLVETLSSKKQHCQKGFCTRTDYYHNDFTYKSSFA
jgi:hypothetical protein